MSEIEKTGRGKVWFRVLFWPVLLAFICISLILAMDWFFSLELDRSFFNALVYHWILLAALAQALGTFLFIYAWHINLQIHGFAEISFNKSAILIGLNSIGKYSPGKVLGVLARGLALYKYGGAGNVVIQATVVEQLALIHSGLAIALLAWVFDHGHTILLGIAVVLVPVSLVLVLLFKRLVIQALNRFLKKSVSILIESGFRRSYPPVFGSMVLVWLFSSVALYFCQAAFSPENGWTFVSLLWITVMAYISGFLAFFTLAGLGVREGVMVALLGLQLDLTTAIYISIIHRLITLVFDVLLGCYALFFGRALTANMKAKQGSQD